MDFPERLYLSDYLNDRLPRFFGEDEIKPNTYRVAERGNLRRYRDAQNKLESEKKQTNRKPLSEYSVNSALYVDIDIKALRKRQAEANRARLNPSWKPREFLQDRCVELDCNDAVCCTFMPCTHESVVPSIFRKRKVIEAYEERRRSELFHKRRKEDKANELKERAHVMKRKLERIKKSSLGSKLQCREIYPFLADENMPSYAEDSQEDAWLCSFFGRLEESFNG